jgi:predicted nucleotidyltransferase
MLTEAEIKTLVERIVDFTHPERVIVFGSYAKGTATINSDLDILVVKNTNLPMSKRLDDLVPLLANSLVPIDVHVYTPEEIEAYGAEQFSFINTVLKHGRTIFAK